MIGTSVLHRRVVFRSTGAKEIGAARRIAGDIIKSFWIDSGRSAVRLKLRDDNTTIGELIANYKERAAQRPGTWAFKESSKNES